MLSVLEMAKGFETRRKRRETVNTILICLTAIAEAERNSLNNYPANLQLSDQYDSGEQAVDTLIEVIDLLADVY